MYFVGHPIGQVAYICEAAYPAKILAKYDLTSLHIHTFIQEIRPKTVGLVIRENGAVVFFALVSNSVEFTWQRFQ